jgi:2-dehydropantoate 2-reductase
MRIAIFGTGGAGGYFGAHLARAGEDVVFIARGEHLRAIQENGLQIETRAMIDNREGNANDSGFVVHSTATDDPAEVGNVDVVLVGVKAWQVAAAARDMRPMIGANTVVVPLQNGVDAAADLAKVLGADRVLNGLCGTISRVVAPGHILSIGETNFIKFGEIDHRKSERAERLRKAFAQAGVRVEVPADIEAAVWAKFIFVAPYGGVGAVTRLNAGEIRSSEKTRNQVMSGMEEILAVARARGINLAGDIVVKTMTLLDSLDPNATTSLQRDIAAGKPSELEAWTGAVVRLGKESVVATPVNENIYRSLLPGELKARGAGA